MIQRCFDRKHCKVEDIGYPPVLLALFLIAFFLTFKATLRHFMCDCNLWTFNAFFS
jgi:hypothetical protein